jgi:hypothetical protein
LEFSEECYYEEHLVVQVLALHHLAEVKTHRHTRSTAQPDETQKTHQHKEILADIDHQAIVLSLRVRVFKVIMVDHIEGVVREVGREFEPIKRPLS